MGRVQVVQLLDDGRRRIVRLGRERIAGAGRPDQVIGGQAAAGRERHALRSRSLFEAVTDEQAVAIRAWSRQVVDRVEAKAQSTSKTSGRHHSSLSRYQETVAASPVKVTRPSAPIVLPPV